MFILALNKCKCFERLLKPNIKTFKALYVGALCTI